MGAHWVRVGFYGLMGGAVSLGVVAQTARASEGLIAAGGWHSCRVVDGGVECWGDNRFGQLGTGPSLDEVLAAVPVSGLGPGSGVTAVAAGRLHTCAVVDGGLVCWGDNSDGQLGDNTIDTRLLPVPVIASGSGVTGVAAGDKHTCAVVQEGLLCWGRNNSGQLGIGTQQNALVPTPVVSLGSHSGVTAVAVGFEHTCAIVNGTAECWGNNLSGQLGIGNNNSPWLIPTVVADLGNDITALAAGPHHTCAIASGSLAFCWGYNGEGQLGNGSSGSGTPNPTLVHNLNGGSILGIDAGGSENSGSYTCVISEGDVRCWGYNSVGQLGNGTYEPSNVPASPAALSNATALSLGERHACALSESGRTYCWGDDYEGELGRGGPPTIVTSPAISPALQGFENADAGWTHACAILNAGAWCWGNGYPNTLGNGSLLSSAEPVAVMLGNGVSRVSAGYDHSCAIRFGTAYCWGGNGDGQVGNGTSSAQGVGVPTPEAVVGIDVTTLEISGGLNYTCAVGADGRVRCWGSGTDGQLGSGNFQTSYVPVLVQISSNGIPLPLVGVTAVATGVDHACAIADSGVRCWGTNDRGQLGVGSAGSPLATAVQVSGLGSGAGVTALAAGNRDTCALIGDRVKCWGRNDLGELGNGVIVDSPTPVSVLTAPSTPLTGVAAIASGTGHTCAVADGGVVCWGYNLHGQLGIGESSEEPHPWPASVLPPGSGVTHLTAGAEFTCAWSSLLTWCWGNGLAGALGNGDLGYSPVAAPIVIDRMFASGFDDEL